MRDYEITKRLDRIIELLEGLVATYPGMRGGPAIGAGRYQAGETITIEGYDTSQCTCLQDDGGVSPMPCLVHDGV